MKADIESRYSYNFYTNEYQRVNIIFVIIKLIQFLESMV